MLERGERMVTYKPLWHTLIDRGVKKMELVERVGMSRATLSKLNNDNYVALEVLDCPIEAVVEIKKGVLQNEKTAARPLCYTPASADHCA